MSNKLDEYKKLYIEALHQGGLDGDIRAKQLASTVEFGRHIVNVLNEISAVTGIRSYLKQIRSHAGEEKADNKRKAVLKNKIDEQQKIIEEARANDEQMTIELGRLVAKEGLMDQQIEAVKYICTTNLHAAAAVRDECRELNIKV